MVDNKDLRIGNYIKFDSEIDKVLSINNTYICGDKHSVWHIQLCFPIDLSEDILIKCGFEWEEVQGRNYLLSTRFDGGIQLGFAYGVNDKMTLVQKVIPFDSPNRLLLHFGASFPKYLHQLQNLFWCLCGKELNVKL